MLCSDPRRNSALKNHLYFCEGGNEMKTSKRNRGLSFLLALIMLVGMLPISVLSVGAESGGENAVGAPRGAA